MPELSVAGADPGTVFSRVGLRSRWIWRAGHGAPPRPQARQLVEALQELGGLYSAYAGFLRWRADLLPIDYILALRNIKDQAPPINRQEFTRILINDLGLRGEALAANLDEEPCWSTLQRCAYRSRDRGNPVIVQIARPVISEEALKEFEQGIRLVNDSHLHKATSLSALSQFREWLRLSDGVGREAACLKAIEESAPSAGEYPRLIPELCSGRLLCWPWTDGEPITALIAGGSAAVVEKLAELVLEQICVLGLSDAELDLDMLALTTSSRLVVRRANRCVAIPQPAMRACLKYISAVLKMDSPSAAHFLVQLALAQVEIDLEQSLVERLANLEPELKLNVQFPASAAIFESNWRGLASLGREHPLFLDEMHGNLVAVGYSNAAIGGSPDCIADAHWAVMGRLLYKRLASLSSAGHLSDWLLGSGLLMAEGVRQFNRVADGLRADDLAIRVATGGLDRDGAAKTNRPVRNGIGMGMLLILFLVSMRWIVSAPPPFAAVGAGTAALAALGVLWILVRLV